MRRSTPWWAYPLLLSPRRIQESLDAIAASETIDMPDVPNLWQIGLGVLRMYHRLIFRSETIGTSPNGTVRRTWRSRCLSHRLIRGPVLWSQGAIAPFDMSGLSSSPDRIIQHLLAAHHDGHQFAYDLEMLAIWPKQIDRLERHVLAIIDGRDPRANWYKDLAIFRYHQELLEAVQRTQNLDTVYLKIWLKIPTSHFSRTFDGALAKRKVRTIL